MNNHVYKSECVANYIEDEDGSLCLFCDVCKCKIKVTPRCTLRVHVNESGEIDKAYCEQCSSVMVNVH